MPVARHAAVRDTLYKVRFHFWRGPEAAMLARARRDGFQVEAHDGAARTLTYSAPGYGQLVVHLWLSPQYAPTSPFGASCVAHEAVHAALYVWDHIGAKAPDARSDETFAYYVEWIVREFHRRMR